MEITVTYSLIYHIKYNYLGLSQYNQVQNYYISSNSP